MVLGDRRTQAAARAAGQAPPPVAVPVGATTFPGGIFTAPRGWAEAVCPDLAYSNEASGGGHFAAWEEPELLTAGVRALYLDRLPPELAAFRPLRRSDLGPAQRTAVRRPRQSLSRPPRQRRSGGRDGWRGRGGPLERLLADMRDIDDSDLLRRGSGE
ncbi:hypothetical protein [Micromonospora tarensis]|uniref:Uncharacterized protein n=1 Tax=Micromonospora tarensis TaxID=2806100 RepID=A0ABS1YIY7_9ACTN|nr:hypothetical protein [Micromonospora tarensis]MBM0277399.1 hypothetical protein [Micromonospora tarensis]